MLLPGPTFAAAMITAFARCCAPHFPQRRMGGPLKIFYTQIAALLWTPVSCLGLQARSSLSAEGLPRPLSLCHTGAL